MDKTILVGLNGHTEKFPLDAAAHDRLERYLDGAHARLRDNPDRTEILLDLERSVGDRLAGAPGGSDTVFGVGHIDAVLEEIGDVEAGREGPAAGAPIAAKPKRVRRLERITTGQQLAGVCTGLAAYSQIRVDWVRTLFVLATVVTAGVFAVVYVALAFILPVAEETNGATHTA